MDLLADFLHFGTSVFLLHVGLEQCEVWGVKSAVWSVKEAVGSEKCEVWSVKCGVWSLSLECEERSVKCEVWGLECEGSSEKWEVWSVKCEVWSVKFEVWSAKSAVCSVRCGVSREGHGRDRLSLNYRSFIFGKLPPPACPGLCFIYIYIYIYIYSFDPVCWNVGMFLLSCWQFPTQHRRASIAGDGCIAAVPSSCDLHV